MTDRKSSNGIVKYGLKSSTINHSDTSPSSKLYSNNSHAGNLDVPGGEIEPSFNDMGLSAGLRN